MKNAFKQAVIYQLPQPENKRAGNFTLPDPSPNPPFCYWNFWGLQGNNMAIPDDNY